MNGQVKALLVVSVLVASVILGVTLANAVVPTVTVEDATNVSYTTADVEGEVDPQGQSTAWRFQYATEADFSDAQDGPSGTTETPKTVSGTLTGLAPGQTYYLRLLAENADGPSEAIAASTFETLTVAKPTVSIEAPSLLNAAAERYFLSGHVNPNGTDPAFDTEWRFDCSPGCEVANGNGTVPADEESHLLEAEVEGLQPLTTYTVTLHAKNLGGEVTASKTFKTTAAPPLPASAPNTPEPGGQATIRGYLNPRGSTVSNCHFEYGPGEGYGQSVPCEAEDGEPLALGTANEPLPVSAHLTGLTPGATYHYRLVAIGAAGTGSSPDQFFEADEEASEPSCSNQARRAEQHSTALPDCRAYEMVSPVDKNGGDVVAQSKRVRVSTDGDRATFTSLTGFGDTVGGDIASEYMSERTATVSTGWSTHSIFPLQPDSTRSITTASLTSEYVGSFSPDLTRGVIRAWSPLTDAPNVANLANLYLRPDLEQPGSGSYQLISDCPACGSPIPSPFFRFYQPNFVAATPDFGHILFWSKANLVAGAAFFQPNLYEYDHGTLSLVSAGTESAAISEDGNRVFFIDSSGDLFMRDTPTEETVQLNKSEASSPGEPQPAGFAGVSSDGSRILFTSQAALTDDSCGGCINLYMYDASKPASDPQNLQFLTVDHEPSDGSNGEVNAVLGMSNDGQTVYFIDGRQIVAGQPGFNDFGGLFAWHDGTVTYISPLSSESGSNPVSRVTPEGGLLFSLRTAVSPTGYDQGDCDPGKGVQPCDELYLYHPATDSLRCVSCDPTGAPGEADAQVSVNAGSGSLIDAGPANHPISNGGDVFFNTADSLLPSDTNGASDVYSFNTSTGVLHLISTGTDPSDSFFMEANPDGSNVLFATRTRLLGWDTDQGYDLYDARSGGGFPESPPPPPICSGDVCHGPQPPAPAPPPVGSGAEGRGNPRPSHCPKARHAVTRKGHTRCVKSKKHRRADADRRAAK